MSLNKYFLIATLVSMFLLYGVVTVVAAPPGSQYNSAETLDPSCAPGALNCSVDMAFSPDGLDTYVQFNDNGSFGSSSKFIYDEDVRFNVQGEYGPGYVSQVGLTDDIMLELFGSALNVPAAFLAHTETSTGDKGYVTATDLSLFGGGTVGAGMAYVTDDFSHRSSVSVDSTNINIGYDNPTDGVDFKLALDSNGLTFENDTNGDEYTFPIDNGSVGQVLETDGNGILSWTTSGSSPISVGTSGNTLYSSGLTGTGQGDTDSAMASNIFFGDSAGSGATSASFSNFLGSNAGNGATSASNSNFLGFDAGLNATGGNNSNFLGTQAGAEATSASNSNFFGQNAGYSATSASYSNFIGDNAGNGATGASFSNFIGNNAGYSATGANSATFIGQSAGYGGSGAFQSVFVGGESGGLASGAFYASFLGNRTGRGATNASRSTFIGYQAGDGATNAANSIFIGETAGRGLSAPGLNNTTSPDDYSILIGNKTSTAGFENSIALGQVATNTASNQFMIGSSSGTIDTTEFIGSAATSCTITTGTGISCSSDERLKKDVTDIEQSEALAKLLKIQPVSYLWKQGENKNGRQIGFIAQDLEEEFPELVIDGANGYKSVFYSQITPILVSAIQALDKKIESVFNGIADLVVRTLRARDQVCIGDTCINEEQLLDLLDESNVESSHYSSESHNENEEESDVEPTEEEESGDNNETAGGEETSSENNEETTETEEEFETEVADEIIEENEISEEPDSIEEEEIEETEVVEEESEMTEEEPEVVEEPGVVEEGSEEAPMEE